MNIEELFSKLVSYRSVTPHHEGALDFINTFLSDNGFKTYIKEFGPEKIGNLYAVFGSGAPNICLCGHIDVVPAGEGWSYDPFSASCVEGKLYGRGAVDMKGSLAAMLLAAANIAPKITQGSISFLITSDEEGEAQYGTSEMLKWMWQNNHKIDFAILGEPTSEEKICDVIKVGRRGSFSCNLKILGKQGHVAYPHKAKNPIDQLLKIMTDLKALQLDKGTENFDPSNLEVTSIDTGNGTANVIPAEISVRFNIRYNTSHNAESLEKIIRNIVENHTSSYEMKCTSSAEPFISEMHEYTKDLSDIIAINLGYSPKYSTSGGTSDARFIRNYAPVCELGLRSDMAHKIDEYVPFSDLQTLYNVYHDCLRKILC
jgi:succinyl-diaminopimelate desuccinylase